MDSDVKTDKNFLPPLPVGVRALAVLLAHLDEREVGVNQGPVVVWAVKPWTSRIPDGSGWAKWCAGAACTAYLDAGSQQIKAVGSLNVPALWRRCVEHDLVLVDVQPNELLPGDLVFFDHLTRAQGQAPVWSVLAHVGLVERLEGTHLHTVEGNAGDCVARVVYDLDGTRPAKTRIHGYARLQE